MCHYEQEKYAGGNFLENVCISVTILPRRYDGRDQWMKLLNGGLINATFEG